jgi:uncharacterized integral membrane protein
LRTLNSVLAGLVALLVVLFAVSNLELVTIRLWPLPFEATVGVYAVVLLAVLVGFVGGLVTAWFAGAPRRRERKRLRGQVKELEQTLRSTSTPTVP